MTKKILLILGILVIVGLVAFFILGTGAPVGDGGNRIGFFIGDYLPFGQSEDTDLIGDETDIDIGSNNAQPSDQTSENYWISGFGSNNFSTSSPQSIPRLRKLSGEPVAGAIIFGSEGASVVRFVEKGTGNVYEARSDALPVVRLTNTTIPKIIRAFWLPDSSAFLAQTLVEESEIIETSFVKLSKNTASSTSPNFMPFNTTISSLPTGIKEISIKPDGTRIFYYTQNGSGSDWFVSNPDGTKSSLLITHPLTEWLPKWVSSNTLIMQTKGSAGIAGYTYSFDVARKTLTKTGAKILGISSNAKSDGSLILLSNGGVSPKLALADSKGVSVTEISVGTLAEKCVWAEKEESPTVFCAVPKQLPKGQYPDVWYQGLVATEDYIKRMDLKNDVFYNVADLAEESGEKIDVVDPKLSPDGTHLIFRNKIDGYLWILRVEE